MEIIVQYYFYLYFCGFYAMLIRKIVRDICGHGVYGTDLSLHLIVTNRPQGGRTTYLRYVGFYLIL